MRLLLELIVPAFAAFAMFTVIVTSRRIWRGEQPIQPADGMKMAVVMNNVLPLLCACLAYSVVIRARMDLWIELATMLAVLVTLCVSVFRYLRVVAPPER